VLVREVGFWVKGIVFHVCEGRVPTCWGQPYVFINIVSQIIIKLQKYHIFTNQKNFASRLGWILPGPASAVEELRTTEREDPGSTPDEGS
jgi:hypothetical protein